MTRRQVEGVGVADEEGVAAEDAVEGDKARD